MTTEEYFAIEQGKYDAEQQEITYLKSKIGQYQNEKEDMKDYLSSLHDQIDQMKEQIINGRAEYLELGVKLDVQLELNKALKIALGYSEDAAKKGDDARFAAGGMQMELDSFKEFQGYAVRFNNSEWAYLPNEEYAESIEKITGYEIQKLYRKEGE